MSAATEATPPTDEVGPSGPTITYDKHGRPTGVEGNGTSPEKQEAYLEALEGYLPKDHNGRLKSIGLTALRNMTRGGSPIFGAIEAALDPSVDERFAHERDIARASRPVVSAQKRRDAEADTDYRRAQAERARNPIFAPTVVDTEQGTMSVQGTSARPIYDPTGKQIKKKPSDRATKFEIRHNPVDGKAEKWELGQSGQPDQKVDGWSDAAKDLVKTKNGRWVSQGTAETSEALAGQRDYQRGRDGVEDARRVEEKTEARLDKIQGRREKAGQITGKLDGARQAWMAADAKVHQLQERINTEKDAEQKQELIDQMSGWEFQRSKAQADASAAATELSKSYGDLYEAGVTETDENGKPTRGLAYYKAKPLSVSSWRKKYPKATKAQQAAWEQNAKDEGFEVVP